jgi:hypothetical protein
LILVDVFPNEEAKVVEFEAPAEPVPAGGLPNGSVLNGHAPRLVPISH